MAKRVFVQKPLSYSTAVTVLPKLEARLSKNPNPSSCSLHIEFLTGVSLAKTISHLPLLISLRYRYFSYISVVFFASVNFNFILRRWFRLWNVVINIFLPSLIKVTPLALEFILRWKCFPKVSCLRQQQTFQKFFVSFFYKISRNFSHKNLPNVTVWKSSTWKALKNLIFLQIKKFLQQTLFKNIHYAFWLLLSKISSNIFWISSSLATLAVVIKKVCGGLFRLNFSIFFSPLPLSAYSFINSANLLNTYQGNLSSLMPLL